MKNIVLLSLLFAVFGVLDAALYSKSDGVVLIKGQNHLDEVLDDVNDGILVVKFYTPTCTACSTLAPEYIKFAKPLAGIITVASLDCNAADNKQLCAKEGINGFPSIKFYGPGRNPGSLYTGVRTAKDLTAAATKLLTDKHIRKLSEMEEFESFAAESPEKPKAVLFTSKTETTNMFKGLSMQLNNGIDFAEVHESSSDIIESYSVTDFPTLIVTKSDGSVEIYDGALKAPAVFAWLSQFSVAPKKPPRSDDQPRSAKEGDERGDLQLLTLERAFALETKEEMHLLGLLSSECTDTSSLSSFSKAVSEMGKIVDVSLVTVPALEADQIQRWGASASKLKASPCTLQIVLLPFGDEKDNHLIYKGVVTGKALSTWVTSEIPDLTEKITPEGMDFFLSSASPGQNNGPGLDDADEGEIKDDESDDTSSRKLKLKGFLYTDKESAPGIYKALAVKFRNRLSFGYLTSGSREAAALMAKYKVTKHPTIFLIVMVKQSGGWGVQTIPWSGPLKYAEIEAWLDTALAQLAPPTQPNPTNLVSDVSDDQSMNENCLSKGGLCIIGLVGSSSASEDEKIRKAMATTASKRQGQPFAFVLLDASKFRRVAASFGISRVSDLPALVALSAKRMRYASLPSSSSSWDAAGVGSFLDGVLGGKIRTETLSSIPSIIEGGQEVGDDLKEDSTAPSDEASIVEEEFDLSDIMSEEIEDASISGDKMKRVEEELKAEEEAAKKKTTKKKKKSKKSKSKTEL